MLSEFLPAANDFLAQPFGICNPCHGHFIAFDTVGRIQSLCIGQELGTEINSRKYDFHLCRFLLARR